MLGFLLYSTLSLCKKKKKNSNNQVQSLICVYLQFFIRQHLFIYITIFIGQLFRREEVWKKGAKKRCKIRKQRSGADNWDPVVPIEFHKGAGQLGQDPTSDV